MCRSDHKKKPEILASDNLVKHTFKIIVVLIFISFYSIIIHHGGH